MMQAVESGQIRLSCASWKLWKSFWTRFSTVRREHGSAEATILPGVTYKTFTINHLRRSCGRRAFKLRWKMQAVRTFSGAELLPPAIPVNNALIA
jgi:hypothetical protein